jgi:hypothetical protein
MREIYSDYTIAKDNAIAMVKQTKVPVGIERIRRGEERFRICFLPRKENRSGFELRLEAFEPQDYT